MVSEQISARVKNIAKVKLAMWGLGSFFFVFGFATGLKFLSSPSATSGLFNINNASIVIASMFIVFALCFAINRILSIVQRKMLYGENYNAGNISGDAIKIACFSLMTIGGLSFIIHLQKINNLQLGDLVERISIIKTVIPENLLENFGVLSGLEKAANLTVLQTNIAKLRETLGLIMNQAEKLKTVENAEKVQQIQQLMKEMQSGLDRANASGKNVSIIVSVMIIAISIMFGYLIGCAIKEFFSSKNKDEVGFIANNKAENNFPNRLIISCTPTTYLNTVEDGIAVAD